VEGLLTEKLRIIDAFLASRGSRREFRDTAKAEEEGMAVLDRVQSLDKQIKKIRSESAFGRRKSGHSGMALSNVAKVFTTKDFRVDFEGRIRQVFGRTIMRSYD
jgi:hypothetical protein